MGQSPGAGAVAVIVPCVETVTASFHDACPTCHARDRILRRQLAALATMTRLRPVEDRWQN